MTMGHLTKDPEEMKELAMGLAEEIIFMAEGRATVLQVFEK